MIISGTYTSVWDDEIAVTTNCKINSETREVFDIEPSGVNIDGILTNEYIEFNGERHPVSNDGNAKYWYN